MNKRGLVTKYVEDRGDALVLAKLKDFCGDLQDEKVSGLVGLAWHCMEGDIPLSSGISTRNTDRDRVRGLPLKNESAETHESRRKQLLLNISTWHSFGTNREHTNFPNWEESISVHRFMTARPLKSFGIAADYKEGR